MLGRHVELSQPQAQLDLLGHLGLGDLTLRCRAPAPRGRLDGLGQRGAAPALFGRWRWFAGLRSPNGSRYRGSRVPGR